VTYVTAYAVVHIVQFSPVGKIPTQAKEALRQAQGKLWVEHPHGVQLSYVTQEAGGAGGPPEELV